MRAVQLATAVGLALLPGLALGTAPIQRDFRFSTTPAIVLGFVGALLLLASWAASRVSTKWKGRGLIFLGSVVFVLIIVLLVNNVVDATLGMGIFPDWRVNLAVLGVLGSAAGVAGWFAIRERPTRSYAALPIALLALVAALAPSVQFAWVVLAIVPAIIAWVGWLISRATAVPRTSSALSRDASDPSVMASLGRPLGDHIYSAGSVERTNTIALLALIFGILGFGIVPIVLGHIARAQIRRTGEAGSGMALAGLILGYVIVGLGIAYVIFFAVLLGIARSSTLGG